MKEDVYKRLAKHLDRLPIPFPATESGVEIRILKRWFTPEEAEIALAMRGYPEPVSAIAKRLGKEPAALAPVLEDMSKKGLIFRISKGDNRRYNIVPLAEGMWEFHLNTNDKEILNDLNEYMEFFMKNGWYGTPTTQHRIIPISQSITSNMEIMPYEQAEQIIKDQKKISVAPCICRKEQRMLREGCDHPLETCMAFGTGAYYYIENGLGREVTTEEALKILKRGMDSGLVLQPGNGQKSWSICMCCGCCCGLLRGLKTMEKPAYAAHTNFYSQIAADECIACGLCEERCPMDAIQMEGDAAVVNRDRCVGCGVCVGTCNVDAIKLLQKSEHDRYVPPKDVVEMQVKIAQERGLF
jgi:Na+-translocating ferredoxin:NAD+ oxidoreductase subunit B